MVEKKKVLMICLGNICRSPIAEAVFLDQIRKQNLTDEWEVDSAALIGYHTGKSPDHRAMSVIKQHNIQYSHRARVITKDDFNKFNWIFGMDESNISELNRLKPKNCLATVGLLGQFATEEAEIIRDPYYDPDDLGFHAVYDQCVNHIGAFLSQQKNN